MAYSPVLSGAITATELRSRNTIYTSLLFVPYVLLAPLAGYLNDRYAKTKWLVGGNALKLAVLGRGERLDAAAALRISLVDEVVEPDRLLDRAMALAEVIATGSPTAIEASKRAIRGALEAARGR